MALERDLAVILCADWGKDRRKRAVYVADIAERTVRRIASSDWSVSTVLKAAGQWIDRGSVLVTFDAPLGVPASYMAAAAGSPVWAGPKTFLEFLQWVKSDHTFFDQTVSADQWSIERPFFAVPAGDGGLTSFVTAAKRAGVDLYRGIDRLTKAKTVFAKSGIPGSVGSGACALWLELGLALTPDRTFKLWPFEGDLEGLIATSQIVVGEIYPRAAYATALLDVVGGIRPPLAIAKTSIMMRGAAIRALLKTKWIKVHKVSIQDLDAAVSNEDDFDACMTAAALLRCVLEGKQLSPPAPTSDPAEGAILGTAEINLSLPERIFRPESQADLLLKSQPSVAQARKLPGAKGYPCPIFGCEKVFYGSRGGWDAHVGAVRLHPEWHPELDATGDRKKQFACEFPEFFGR